MDVFKPRPASKCKVEMYDVNSLYPSEMAKQYYPVGTPSYVELSIDEAVHSSYFKNKNHFGFYYVDVIAPDHLGSNPLLLKKVGLVSIAGVGNWSGWYFSEELAYAITRGYIITFFFECFSQIRSSG